IELIKPCAEIVALAREQGVLLNVTADSVIRLLPPLIFTQTQADLLIDTLVPIIRQFLGQ
ncbi:aspartate aminotransferase family protein, partial [Acinetobacter baumannii]